MLDWTRGQIDHLLKDLGQTTTEELMHKEHEWAYDVHDVDLTKDVALFLGKIGQFENHILNPVGSMQVRKHLQLEEAKEFEAAVDRGDEAEMADAIIDIIYSAVATAVLMDLPIRALWDEVQRTNMQKERAVPGEDKDGKGRGIFNAVKPAGWQPPQIRAILDVFAALKKGGKRSYEE